MEIICTPIADIMQNISIITGFPVDEFECKRKDHSLIALSSHLPNGSELYIEKKIIAEQMVIFVKSQTGKTITLDVKPNDTFHKIKWKISRRDGMDYAFVFRY